MTAHLPFAIAGGERWSVEAITRDELARARHALAYLKSRIGDGAMRALVADDVAAMTTEVRDWVAASHGEWQHGAVELVVSGPDAAAFHHWYGQAIAERQTMVLRAGHPEHFVMDPGDGAIEVIENIGETALPWHIFYRGLSESATFPIAWNPIYPERFGAEIRDRDDLLVGYTMHQGRDAADGMHLKLTTILPAAAPATLLQRHLHHFAIEFSNWTQAARDVQDELL